jgi:hypothetical protein
MNRTITYIAILQTAAVVLGFLTLGIVLKYHGYPDHGFGVRWKAFPVYLREYGLWLMLVPAVWTAFASKAHRMDRGLFSERPTLIAGACLAGIIIALFIYGAGDPYTRPTYFYFGK